MLMTSEIILAKGIKLDRDYNNVLDYNETQMLELMRSNAHFVAGSTDYSFIRQTRGLIKTNFTYLQALQSNYIAFKNPDYANKWFFAFVDNIEYKGENNTYIYYTVDSWMTWFKSLTIEPCYVIREHTNNDAIGSNTIDEGLAVQDYISEGSFVVGGIDDQFSTPWIGVLTNWDVASKLGFTICNVLNRSVFGQELCLFRMNDAGMDDLTDFVAQTGVDGHPEDIQNIFIIPYNLIDQSDLEEHNFEFQIGGIHQDDGTYYTLRSYTYDAVTSEFNVPKKTTFSDFVPKNNKCFVYPYNYLYGTNNIGNDNIFKYERFSNGSNATFQLEMGISIGCSGRIVPTGYKGVNKFIDEGLPLAKFPTCGWSSDSFTNWLTQQAVNGASQVMDYGFDKVDEVTGNQPIAEARNFIKNAIGVFTSNQIKPRQSASGSSGDINFVSKNNTFIFKQMRAKTEYLRVIDDYFTKYGYKTMRIKLPNITGRRNFNYVEIASAESIGYGSIPNEHENIINNACRKGVTIWHDHANLGDFTVDNSIIQ